MCERGRQKIGVPSLRNHAERRSRPVAVGRRLSRIFFKNNSPFRSCNR